MAFRDLAFRGNRAMRASLPRTPSSSAATWFLRWVNSRELGYEDGLRIGARDRNTGHSFRPTNGERFEDADRGYNSGFGSKQEYKDTYRSGYREGYERGYNRGR